MCFFCPMANCVESPLSFEKFPFIDWLLSEPGDLKHLYLERVSSLCESRTRRGCWGSRWGGVEGGGWGVGACTVNDLQRGPWWPSGQMKDKKNRSKKGKIWQYPRIFALESRFLRKRPVEVGEKQSWRFFKKKLVFSYCKNVFFSVVFWNDGKTKGGRAKAMGYVGRDMGTTKCIQITSYKLRKLKEIWIFIYKSKVFFKKLNRIFSISNVTIVN